MKNEKNLTEIKRETMIDSLYTYINVIAKINEASKNDVVYVLKETAKNIKSMPHHYSIRKNSKSNMRKLLNNK